jgi:hypothetical protein
MTWLLLAVVLLFDSNSQYWRGGDPKRTTGRKFSVNSFLVGLTCLRENVTLIWSLISNPPCPWLATVHLPATPLLDCNNTWKTLYHLILLSNIQFDSMLLTATWSRLDLGNDMCSKDCEVPFNLINSWLRSFENGLWPFHWPFNPAP